MDAAEHDADVKLYKASGELLAELQAKLPLLVRTSKPRPGQIRKWIVDSKVDDITGLVRQLDRFQEWPQLLDPYLADNINVLVNAFLHYCTSSRDAYSNKHDQHAQIIPLPRAIARVLYAYCKVRGQKIIVRLLNNEPKFIEPLLLCFRMWTYDAGIKDTQTAGTMTWEERYIVLLWLSHLMLAPFALASISGLATGSKQHHLVQRESSLPRVATNLFELALDHLRVSSKAREAASLLVVRLALRGDMQACGMPNILVDWAMTEINSTSADKNPGDYHNIGLLSLLFGMVNSSSDSESASFVTKLLTFVHTIADPENVQYLSVRDQAAARKLIVKIMRASLSHLIALSSGQISQTYNVDLESALETSVQILLDYLADKDTPVRQAASKALGLLCLKLDFDMAREVIEAVLGCLDENVLLENLTTGDLIPITDLPMANSNEYRKTIGAVDPLRWHGAMLTLGHLLFRRAPPSDQLPAIIEALLVGLEFEQRSNVGTSIGVSVRDAACFGIWSLARKYSASNMATVAVNVTMLPHGSEVAAADNINVVQVIAIRLVISACLDPSGNIRRGSSAALQELIGRHPDVVAEGISVVQVVDYHAIARRSRAIGEVALQVSKFDDRYHSALQYALLLWSGARATDAESRRFAAKAVGELFSSIPQTRRRTYLWHVWSQITKLRRSNVGVNAAARHGLLLSLARMLDMAVIRFSDADLKYINKFMTSCLDDVSLLTGSVEGRITADIENVMEATADFIASYALLVKVLTASNNSETVAMQGRAWVQPVLSILDRCTVSADKSFTTLTAARANVSMLSLLPHSTSLIDSWLDPKVQKKSDFACKGRIATFSAIITEGVQGTVDQEENIQDRIISYLCHVVKNPAYSIETKVDAVHGMNNILSSARIFGSGLLRQLQDAIETGMSDYTVDQRGDIGSQLRLSSVATAQVLASREIEPSATQAMLQLIVKLAAERLAKVRFQAWRSLKAFLSVSGRQELLVMGGHERDRDLTLASFEHQADVSSPAYYEALLQLLRFGQLRGHLILGLISSLSAGTDEVSRAAMAAMITTIRGYGDNTVRKDIIDAMLTFSTEHLIAIANHDDREVIPIIDFLSFLLEQLSLLLNVDDAASIDSKTIWSAVQKAHAPASTIQRLEALVRLYSCMLNVTQLRALTLDRMTRLLLHKWPKIRYNTASAIFFNTSVETMLQIDWHAPATSNKGAVVQLRKILQVT